MAKVQRGKKGPRGLEKGKWSRDTGPNFERTRVNGSAKPNGYTKRE